MVVIIGAIIIVALAVTVALLLNRETELPTGPDPGAYRRELGGRGFVVTPENVEEIREQIDETQSRLTPADMHFQFSLLPNWTFTNTLTPSNDALVRNVATNSRTVFFDVYIEELDLVVYVSPFMPLGSEHRGFALDYELDPGVYDAVLTYFLVDDDLEILTDVSIGITITVEN